MEERNSDEQRAALIADVVQARLDVTALAEAHGLTPEGLAAWVEDASNRRCLTGLRELADLQAQLLVSRCRVLAISRLIALATQQEAGVSNDVARRACVDLLKLDLTAGMDGSAGAERSTDGEDEGDALRALLYGRLAEEGEAEGG